MSQRNPASFRFTRDRLSIFYTPPLVWRFLSKIKSSSLVARGVRPGHGGQDQDPADQDHGTEGCSVAQCLDGVTATELLSKLRRVVRDRIAGVVFHGVVNLVQGSSLAR